MLNFQKKDIENQFKWKMDLIIDQLKKQEGAGISNGGNMTRRFFVNLEMSSTIARLKKIIPWTFFNNITSKEINNNIMGIEINFELFDDKYAIEKYKLLI